ncbi:pyrophosphatase PpaX [Bacillus sp. JCM 19046]|nr:pyrophosphatase PpaX [Bacillus sp. JCM 19045]GAF18401.1 pyrophosphatase PpaX [Bacillus sp. JCM 19046]
MSINTILFDLDGTLIDTNELIIRSFIHTLEEDYPGKYTRETVLPFIGPSLYETFSSINATKTDQFITKYRQYNHKHHDELVVIFPGVLEGIKQLHAQGFKLAIVTTKISQTALMGLKLTGLDRYFDVLVGLDHVQHEKPHPEPLFKALEQLQSTPDKTLMVGDNSHDIEAGKNAGTKTAAVGWAIKGRSYIESLEPDYILDSMTDLIHIVKQS